MRAAAALAVTGLLMAWPASVSGWGMDVHRFLTGHVIDQMPDALRPFYAEQRAFIIEHSVDPDLWRVVELGGARGPEEPNHFLDIDGLDEPAPFRNVPREWDAYVARYGAERANRMGRLPWRVEEVYGRLVRAFKDAGSGRAPYAADNARYLTAVLAHYVQDAHVPFHAVLNYDGQLTGQRGIHSRFETELVLRHLKTWRIAPVSVRPVANAKEDIFARLVEGHALVERILAADKRAIVGRELYDDAYFAALFDEVRPIVERRLNESVVATVSMVMAAWTDAGRPALPVRTARGPAPIRR
jgi:hypothetical protein